MTRHTVTTVEDRLRISALTLLCPPVFYIRRRKWGAVILTGYLWAVGLLCAVIAVIEPSPGIFPLLFFGLFFWLLCFGGIASTRSREKNPRPVSRRRRAFTRVFGVVLLSPVVIVAVSFSVMFVNASNRSEAFCAEIVVGAPVEGLEARAHELGLRVISHPAEGAQPGQIVAFGLAPYWPRCVVEHVNSKVVGKRAFSTAFRPLPEAGSHHVQL